MFDLELDADVTARDASVGRLRALVCDPVTEEVTHLVVDADGVPGADRLVPISQVTEEHDHVVLDMTRHEFFRLPTFVTPRALPGDTEWGHGAGATRWHVSGQQPPSGTMTYALHRRIPPSTIAVENGTPVSDVDGRRVGRVHALMVDPMTHDVTHVAVSQLRRLHHEDIPVPIEHVEHVGEHEVRLTIDERTLHALADERRSARERSDA